MGVLSGSQSPYLVGLRGYSPRRIRDDAAGAGSQPLWGVSNGLARTIFNGRAFHEYIYPPMPINLPSIPEMLRVLSNFTKGQRKIFCTVGDFRHYFHQFTFLDSIAQLCDHGLSRTLRAGRVFQQSSVSSRRTPQRHTEGDPDELDFETDLIRMRE